MYDEDEVIHPLEDPNYDPVHKPTAHKPIPDIVSRWNPASQVRWFERFANVLQLAGLRKEGVDCGLRTSKAKVDWGGDADLILDLPR